MNLRGKLFLLWAVVATGLALVAVFILVQMIQPKLAGAARLGGSLDFPIGSHTLFECDRDAVTCQKIPDTSSFVSSLHYYDQQNGDYRAPWIWVTHESADVWNAFVAISPHRGCFVNWIVERNRFEEPCYGSRWNQDGSYQEGPTPRGLDSYPVRAEFGNVWIDFELIRGQNHN